MPKRLSSVLLCTSIVVAIRLQAFGQGTLSDYQRAQQFLPGNLQGLVSFADVAPHWIKDTNRFWYRKVNEKGFEFLLVDADQKTVKPAFDHTRLAAALVNASQRQVIATELPFQDFEYKENGSSAEFETDGTKWTCDLNQYQCKQVPAALESKYERLSPDGRWAAFVKSHDLYLRDVSTGTVLRLTSDGEEGDDYATPLPSLRDLIDQGTEDIRQPAAVFWSPDSSKLVTYRTDSRYAGRFTSLQFVPPGQLRPKAFTYVYPLPGEVLPKAQPVIFDVFKMKRIDVKTAPLDLPFQEGPTFEWLPDNKTIYYDESSRGYKSLELRLVDAATGDQKVFLKEDSDTYVDPGETFFRFVEGTGEVITTSERDGWNHLYLYSKTGELENQITRGPWVVRQITHIDAKNRIVYFLAGGREKGEDPYQRHLYSSHFDGTDLKLLSAEDADHDVSVSPNGNYYVDTYSRPDMPGRAVLRRIQDNAEVRVLENGSADALTKMGWAFPEPFRGKAEDGATDLYGLIWVPCHLDHSKKYPIIEQAYTGPQGFFVPKTFARAVRGSEQSMAELGFIVVMVDGRGTVGRSRAFHQFSYHNLGGAFADHVAMIKQMAAKYPYMDVNRVGIYGTSAGGYGAAHAMLAFPDFYKVCVSISGDHDARLDKAWWNEVYQGYPVGDDYVQQSNVTMAGRLKGHLLLEHGDVDENVHPVETMRMVDALIKANKNFDMLLVPNMFHGESGNLYVVRRRWDYFVEHLLGVMPPSGVELKERKDLSAGRRR
ncbi:MAG: DPP IV N-terminal domain-containing protein [Acidobacteriaceae bacterium]|nr:DPP IV N-terminal domain-containing protein [Acidobacteriaceae bacterium]